MKASKLVLPLRLLVALVISALLHGVLIVGVRLPKAPSASFAAPVIEARIVSFDLVNGKATPEATAREAEHESEAPRKERELPEPVPAPGDATRSEGGPLPAPIAELQPGDTASVTGVPANERPQLLTRVEPVYPELAKTKGLSGKVTLQLLIDEAGAVSEVKVVASEPAGVFDEAALAAFRNAIFSPARKGGNAVASRMLLQIFFDLNDSKAAR